MARIAVVTSHPPFLEGGHLVIARALVKALRAAGHDASVICTPQNRFGRQGAAYLATWLTDVGMTGHGKRIDQVISLRYPSYAVRHEAHACWLTHTMREYYDRWDAFRAPLSWRGRIKETIRRRCIQAADRYLLTRNVRRVLAISRTVADRLRRWGGIHCDALHPPPAPRPYRCDGYGDYIFAVSRLTPLKRLNLMIEALAQPEADAIRGVIAGEGEEAAALGRAITRYGLQSRVQLVGRIDEEQLVAHLARCRAVCFPPVDEDYGFVTVEAFASRKPVITCTDSGGPTELVRDGENGLVCAPTAAALAAAMRRLTDDSALAERLGGAGCRTASSLSWERTIEPLVLV